MILKFKEVDMCITMTTPSDTKTSAMDTSYFVFEDDTSIIIPYPTNQADKIDTLVAPFQAEVESLMSL